MNINEYEKVQNNVSEVVEKNKALMNMKLRKTILEKTQAVREYIQLCKDLNENNFDFDETMIKTVDKVLTNTEDSYNYLFDLGIYECVVEEAINDNLEDVVEIFHLYEDLESRKMYFLNNSGEFELFPGYVISLLNEEYKERFDKKYNEFNELRKNFIWQIATGLHTYEEIEEYLKNSSNCLVKKIK